MLSATLQRLRWCQRALCLITTSKSSKLEQVAEGRGFVVTTEKVQCALQPGVQPNGYYQARSMCTLQNSIHMRLDPQPGETQMALVPIAGKTGRFILVHDVRLIRSDEVTEAKNSMERLVLLSVDISSAAAFRGNKHVAWTPDNARKCRRLSRSPTETWEPPLETCIATVPTLQRVGCDGHGESPSSSCAVGFRWWRC